MNKFPEILSNTFKEVDGKQYFVRKFGYNNIVIEEHLIPVPAEKITRTFKDDGTEELLKQKTEPLKK